MAAGCWGGLLTLGAKLRGVAGVIADGPVRDIDEARAHDFPIFTHTLTALTARGRVVEYECRHQRLRCLRRSGDYVIADRSAAVFVAAADIGRVLDAAEMIAAREAAMAKALLAGKPIGSVMGGDYEHMLQAAP